MNSKKFLNIKKTAQVASYVALMTLLSGKVMGQSSDAGSLSGASLTSTENNLTVTSGGAVIDPSLKLPSAESENNITITSGGALPVSHSICKVVGSNNIAITGDITMTDNSIIMIMIGAGTIIDITGAGTDAGSITITGAGTMMMQAVGTIMATCSNRTIACEPRAGRESTIYCDIPLNMTFQVNGKNVTVDDYCAFLNAVATVDTYQLYRDEMGEDVDGNGGPYIIRYGTPDHRTYQAVDGKRGEPITSAMYCNMARYCNWLQNGQPTGAQGQETTETGAYSVEVINDPQDQKFCLLEEANYRFTSIIHLDY